MAEQTGNEWAIDQTSGFQPAPNGEDQALFRLRAVESSDRLAGNLSPWVREMLGRGGEPGSQRGTLVQRIMGRSRPQSFTFNLTLALLRRFHRIVTRSGAWSADVGSIDPNLFERFASEMFARREMGANPIRDMMNLSGQDTGLQMPLAGAGEAQPAAQQQPAQPLTMEEIRRRIAEARQFRSDSPSAQPNFVVAQQNQQAAATPAPPTSGSAGHPTGEQAQRQPAFQPPLPTERPPQVQSGETSGQPSGSPQQGPAVGPVQQPPGPEQQASNQDLPPRLRRRRFARKVEYLSMPESEDDGDENGDDEPSHLIRPGTGPPDLFLDDFLDLAPIENQEQFVPAPSRLGSLPARGRQIPSKLAQRRGAARPAPLTRAKIRPAARSSAPSRRMRTVHALPPRRGPGILQRVTGRLHQAVSGKLLAGRPHTLLLQLHRRAGGAQGRSPLSPAGDPSAALPAHSTTVPDFGRLPSSREQRPSSLSPSVLPVSLDDFALPLVNPAVNSPPVASSAGEAGYPARHERFAELPPRQPLHVRRQTQTDESRPVLPPDDRPTAGSVARTDRESATSTSGADDQPDQDDTPPAPLRPTPSPPAVPVASPVATAVGRARLTVPPRGRAARRQQSLAPSVAPDVALAALQVRPLRPPPTVMRLVASDALPADSDRFQPQPSPVQSPTAHLSIPFEPVSASWRQARLPELLAEQPGDIGPQNDDDSAGTAVVGRIPVRSSGPARLHRAFLQQMGTVLPTPVGALLPSADDGPDPSRTPAPAIFGQEPGRLRSAAHAYGQVSREPLALARIRPTAVTEQPAQPFRQLELPRRPAVARKVLASRLERGAASNAQPSATPAEMPAAAGVRDTRPSSVRADTPAADSASHPPRPRPRRERAVTLSERIVRRTTPRTGGRTVHRSERGHSPAVDLVPEVVSVVQHQPPRGRTQQGQTVDVSPTRPVLPIQRGFVHPTAGGRRPSTSTGPRPPAGEGPGLLRRRPPLVEPVSALWHVGLLRSMDVEDAVSRIPPESAGSPFPQAAAQPGSDTGFTPSPAADQPVTDLLGPGTLLIDRLSRSSLLAEQPQVRPRYHPPAMPLRAASARPGTGEPVRSSSPPATLLERLVQKDRSGRRLQAMTRSPASVFSRSPVQVAQSPAVIADRPARPPGVLPRPEYNISYRFAPIPASPAPGTDQVATLQPATMRPATRRPAMMREEPAVLSASANEQHVRQSAGVRPAPVETPARPAPAAAATPELTAPGRAIIVSRPSTPRILQRRHRPGAVAVDAANLAAARAGQTQLGPVSVAWHPAMLYGEPTGFSGALGASPAVQAVSGSPSSTGSDPSALLRPGSLLVDRLSRSSILQPSGEPSLPELTLRRAQGAVSRAVSSGFQQQQTRSSLSRPARVALRRPATAVQADVQALASQESARRRQRLRLRPHRPVRSEDSPSPQPAPASQTAYTAPALARSPSPGPITPLVAQVLQRDFAGSRANMASTGPLVLPTAGTGRVQRSVGGLAPSQSTVSAAGSGQLPTATGPTATAVTRPPVAGADRAGRVPDHEAARTGLLPLVADPAMGARDVPTALGTSLIETVASARPGTELTRTLIQLQQRSLHQIGLPRLMGPPATPGDAGLADFVPVPAALFHSPADDALLRRSLAGGAGPVVRRVAEPGAAARPLLLPRLRPTRQTQTSRESSGMGLDLVGPTFQAQGPLRPESSPERQRQPVPQTPARLLRTWALDRSDRQPVGSTEGQRQPELERPRRNPPAILPAASLPDPPESGQVTAPRVREQPPTPRLDLAASPATAGAVARRSQNQASRLVQRRQPVPVSDSWRPALLQEQVQSIDGLPATGSDILPTPPDRTVRPRVRSRTLQNLWRRARPRGPGDQPLFAQPTSGTGPASAADGGILASPWQGAPRSGETLQSGSTARMQPLTLALSRLAASAQRTESTGNVGAALIQPAQVDRHVLGTLEAGGWRFKRSSNPVSSRPDQVRRALERVAAGRADVPLPTEPRTLLERVLQRDFSGVRIQMASLGALGVEAAARDRTILLDNRHAQLDSPDTLVNPGRNPSIGTMRGKEAGFLPWDLQPTERDLLGHELTHVAASGAVPLSSQSRPTPSQSGVPQAPVAPAAATEPLPVAPRQHLTRLLSRRLVQLSVQEEEGLATSVEQEVRRQTRFPPYRPGPVHAPAPIDERPRSVAALAHRRMQASRFAPVSNAWPATDRRGQMAFPFRISALDAPSSLGEQDAQPLVDQSEVGEIGRGSVALTGAQPLPEFPLAGGRRLEAGAGQVGDERTRATETVARMESAGWRFRRAGLPARARPELVERSADVLARSAESRPGTPLPRRPRTLLESVLQRDFSGVRMQTVGLEPLGVDAAAQGNTVFLQRDTAAHLEQPDNLALLGHELAHVTAAGQAPVLRRRIQPDDNGRVVGSAAVPTAAASRPDSPIPAASAGLPLGPLPVVQRSIAQEEALATQVESGIRSLLTGQPTGADSASRGAVRQPVSASGRQESSRTGSVQRNGSHGTGSILAGLATDDMPVVQRFLQQPTPQTEGFLGGDQSESGQEMPSLPAVQRELDGTELVEAELPQARQESGDTEEPESAQEPDWDQLAEKVYPMVRRMLLLERDRRPR